MRQTLQTQSDYNALSIAASTPTVTAITESPGPVIPLPVFQQPVLTAEIPPNVVPVGETNAAANNNLIVIGVAALGIGLLLMQGKGSSVGKKGKNSSLLPLLLAGGVAIWYFTRNNGATSTVPAETVPPIGAPVEPTTGTGQPPAITAPVDVAAAARGYTAASDAAALQRDWPLVAPVLPLMSDAEIIYLYNYFYGYVLPGKKLYQYPGPTGVFPDGGWYTALFNAVTAISRNYNLKII